MRARQHQFLVRLNEKEYQDLQKSISRTGLSREAYIRKLICGYIPKEQPDPDYFKMMRELNSIGNNLNQIAKIANATGTINEDYYREQIRKLDEEILKINSAVILPERIDYGNDKNMEH